MSCLKLTTCKICNSSRPTLSKALHYAHAQAHVAHVQAKSLRESLITQVLKEVTVKLIIEGAQVPKD